MNHLHAIYIIIFFCQHRQLINKNATTQKKCSNVIRDLTATIQFICILVTKYLKYYEEKKYWITY